MGNNSSSPKKKTAAKTTRTIVVEDGNAKSPSKKKTAIVKAKRHMPARIIKDAEIIEQPKKAPVVIKKSAETKKKSPSSSNPASPQADKNTKPTAHAEKAPKVKKKVKLPLIRRIHIKARYLVAAALVLIIAIFFGRVAIWEHNYLLAMEGTERDIPKVEEPEEGGIYEGSEQVEEIKPTDNEIKEYIVAPDKPRYLTIKSLSIYNAIVVEIGLKEGGELGTPNSAYYVGWYTGSVLPGENGVTLLDAHGGDLGVGIFRHLPRIEVGAEITVEMGDGQKYTYVVVDKATKNLGQDANDYMGTAFSSPQPGSPSMTLITCTGEWSQLQQTYLQRLFVHAILKQ